MTKLTKVAACALAPAALLASSALAQTVVYSPDLSGVTLHETGGTYATGNYSVVSSKNATASDVVGSSLKLEMASTTSGFAEVQAVFTNTPVSLVSDGSWVRLDFTFRGAGIISDAASVTNGTLNVGLFNSGGVAPATDLGDTGLVGSGKAGYESGFVAGWAGYVGRFGKTGFASDFINTRPVQTTEVAGNTENQDLLFANAGTGAFDNPTGTALTSPAATLALTDGASYTVSFLIANNAGNYDITYSLFDGTTTASPLLSSITGVASGGNILTAEFDSLAIGHRFAASTGAISSITIDTLQVTTSSVPEPSAYAALAGLAGLALVGLRRRRG